MKQILIVGMGELGKHLAYKLNELNNEVCIIDSNPDLIRVMSEDFQNAYSGNCMDKTTLSNLGIPNFDICVVAIGNNFQASLEITNHLKELGAKYIISKASSDIQAKFLKMAGANKTIYPEKDMAERLAIRCNAQNLFDYIELPGNYGIYEIQVLKSWAGKSLIQLDLRNKYHINIIAIRKNKTEIIMPDANYIIDENDHIYLIATFADAKKLTK